MPISEFAELRWCGAEELDLLIAERRMRHQQRGEAGGFTLDKIAIRRIDPEQGEMSKGRIARIAPLIDRVRVESIIIMPRGAHDSVVRWLIGLYEHPPRPIAAARPASNLREELEGPLARPEITEREALIGEDDADERDVRDIMSLRHHLRADEDIVALCPKIREEALEALMVRYVPIEAGDLRLGKLRAQCLLKPLGPKRKARERLSAAEGAFTVERRRMVTIMAAQAPLRFMRRHGDAA